jgi:hypothetical protein
MVERLAPPVTLYAKQPAPAAPQPAPAVQQPFVLQAVQQPVVLQSDALQSAGEQPVQKLKVALQPEVLLRPEAILQAKAFHGPKSPAILDAIPAEARPVVMPEASLGTSLVELPDPLLDLTPQEETFADRLADLADLLHGERIPYTAPRIFQESAAPGPRVEAVAEKAPVVVDVTFHEDVTTNGTPARPLLVAPPSLLLLAEPQPPSIAPDIPIEAFEPRAALAGRSQMHMGADLGPEPAAASPVRLPEPPNRAVAPALAPLEDYSETADRLMRPVELGPKTASSRALPTVTLPGPALPRELMSLQAAGLVPIRKGGRRAEAPPSRNGWVVKYVVVGLLLTAGIATYSLMPGSSTSAPPRPTPEPTPEPPVSAQSTRPANSLARLVEVTGVRFMEVNKKPQIHYLVVNHSGAPLASMTVYVTLRATTAKPGQPPIAKLTFRSPALAAFEAKEMFSSIERAESVDLPDWQDLRADVDVQ